MRLAAAAQMQPLLGPETAVVSAVNGVPWWYFYGLAGAHEGRTVESVDPGGEIGRAIPLAQVVGCVVHASCTTPAPGLVRQVMGNGLIVGEARVKGMHAAPPETIWRGYGTESRIPKNLFEEYAKGADRLYAYRLGNPIRYGKPKTLSDIGLKRAPQSWCYLPETGPAGPEPAMEGLN